MNKINFVRVVPKVFAGQDLSHSHVWQQTIDFDRGRHYLIEAQSGTGKTSLCNFVTGLRRDYDGTICFDNRDIRGLSRNDWTNLRCRHLSHIFQELRLFPELTALENVEIKNRLTGWKKKKEIRLWFDELGIADKINTKVALMSFGQQQRVAFMRALVQPFDFLLADEPVSHLDDFNSSIVTRLMLDECKRQGAGLIITSIGRHPVMEYDKTLTL